MSESFSSFLLRALAFLHFDRLLPLTAQVSEGLRFLLEPWELAVVKASR